MATATTYSSVNMETAQVWYGYVTKANSSHIQISYGNYLQNYYGNFLYDSDYLSGGTVTSSNYYEFGSKTYEVTGVNLSAITVEYYLDTDNIRGLFNYTFSGNDTFNGSHENDVLKGYSGNDTIFANAGNDELEGGAGNDYLDGGTGIDTAKYAGNHTNYTIQITSIVDNFTSDGVDTLTNIERLEFADINVALDLDGNAGQAYRIYKAAFDRTPDLTGLGYWINDLDAGASLLDVSAGFTHSNEFYGLYGENSSNLDFITLLYNNVLDRAPDESGYAYWLNELDNGINTREGILIGFSESAENQLAVIELIANGIEYTEWVG
ncbi:MAG: DUF4214 domain-containing protein [Candidatus Thioglobus sp.]